MVEPLLVFDASPLVAWMLDEPSAAAVDQLLVDIREGQRSGAITSVNFGEVLYVVDRRSRPLRDRTMGTLLALDLEVVAVDLEIATQAARFKARYRTGYLDSIAAALASLRGGILVTGDRGVAPLGQEIAIEWLT